MLAQMKGWVDAGLVPGMTAAIVSPRGTWTAAVGVDGQGVALEPASGMALAHLTQSFVAAEALLLAECGKLDLDAPASTYVDLPQLANGTTLPQLLAHRSGIHDPAEEAYAKLYTSPDTHWSTQRALAPVPRATAAPDETFSEEAVNYLLAGLVLDKAAGRSTSAAIDADLWTPLGLERLAFQDEQTLAEPIAAPGQDEVLDVPVTEERRAAHRLRRRRLRSGDLRPHPGGVVRVQHRRCRPRRRDSRVPQRPGRLPGPPAERGRAGAVRGRDDRLRRQARGGRQSSRVTRPAA